MKPVFQKYINTENGDCIQACLASLFEIDYDAVPVFEPRQWRTTFAEFCRERGIVWVNVPMENDSARIQFSRNNKHLYCECLIAVESFAFPGEMHCVVGKIEKGHILLTHDPNPNNDPNHVRRIMELDILIPA